MEEKTAKQKALELAVILEDGKGEDVTVLEVSKLTSCAEYFIIATIHSSAHWQGLAKAVKDYVRDNELEIHLAQRRDSDNENDRMQLCREESLPLRPHHKEQCENRQILPSARHPALLYNTRPHPPLLPQGSRRGETILCR